MKRSFNGLTILQKIFVGSLIFILPVIVLLFYTVSGFNHNIRFARVEMQGIRLLIPLEGLAGLIPEHQFLMSLYGKGDKSWEGKINEVAQAIDKQFSTLLKDGKSLEGQLKVDETSLKSARMERSHFSMIYKDWQQLRSQWKDMDNLKSDKQHEAVLESLNTLIKRVGAMSNMVLDPDMDSYYVMDMGFITMPQMQQRLVDFMLFVETVIYKGFINKEDAARFVIFDAMIQSDLQSIRRSMETALSENNRLYGPGNSFQKNIPPLVAAYESKALTFLVIVKRFINDPKFKITAADFFDSGKNLLDSGVKLREATMRELESLLDRRADRYANKRFTALFLSLAALLFASGVFFFISRGITKSLGKAITVAREIAGGDLQKAVESLDITGKDEPGLDGKTRDRIEKGRNQIYQLFVAMTTMTSSLRSLLLQVSRSGSQVNASSAKIAASARELEATVTEQAASINEVSATSREISATSQEFTRTMNKVADMASQASELASASMASLADINGTMKRLLEGTNESSQKLQRVNEKMENITQVITTITKVANQINLLSLNAAIEAEKAGEYGIGFSVVAREIRRLADQTAVAAIDIEGTITEIQESMKEGVSAVETYTNQTRTSTERIAEISVDLLRAIEHTQELVPQFESVNQGMQMQSQSAAQISEAMEQLNEAAKQTGDSLAEFRSVTEQLNVAVKDLQQEVARFSIG